ncbi:MAG: hypothetical protein NT027_11025 [Proteobacteria bacterium]|nr:hypothetical protein [Pseudomonadota bacterium]
MIYDIKNLSMVFVLLAASIATLSTDIRAEERTRTVNISAKDDAETSDRWPHVSYQSLSQFCYPGNDIRKIDMMRKASFASNTINFGELVERLVTGPIKSRLNIQWVSTLSITGTIDISDLDSLKAHVSDIANVYDLTGSEVFPASPQN